MKRIHDDEMPYEELSKFGLTREMVEDLPLDVYESIQKGKVSPVLPITVMAENGHAIKARSRIKLCNETGDVKLLFYPRLDCAPIDTLSVDVQQELSHGRVILTDLDVNGEKVKCFAQIDEDTNQIVSVPSPVVGRNLQVLADVQNLSSAELIVLQGGDPITLLVDDEETTVGLDLLNSDSGIRVCEGDSDQWKKANKREWDKYTFGCYGCWIMDDYGDLSYTPEEEYDEELWNELKKRSGGITGAPKR